MEMMINKIKRYLRTIKYRREMVPEYKDMVFELSGPEGGDWAGLKVTEVSFDGKNRSHYIGQYLGESDTIRYYMKVVGFRDKRAPIRNWGICIRKNFKDIAKARVSDIQKIYIKLLSNYLKKKRRLV